MSVIGIISCCAGDFPYRNKKDAIFAHFNEAVFNVTALLEYPQVYFRGLTPGQDVIHEMKGDAAAGPQADNVSIGRA